MRYAVNVLIVAAFLLSIAFLSTSLDDNKIVQEKGWTHYYKNGELHRDGAPAITGPNGEKMWYQYGNKHRDDGPAIELPSGHKYWYVNNVLHRDDGPAFITNDRSEWYKNGVLDRENGEPQVEYKDGTKLWYHEGEIYEKHGEKGEIVRK